jgi:hypothetical protein
MAKRAAGANPFTVAQIEAMGNLIDVGTQVSQYLQRCANCPQLAPQVPHLQSQVQAVVDGMTALKEEFGTDARFE